MAFIAQFYRMVNKIKMKYQRCFLELYCLFYVVKSIMELFDDLLQERLKNISWQPF